MEERVEVAKRLIAGAVLRDICMASGRMSRQIASPGELSEPEMAIRHSTTVSRTGPRGFVVRAVLVLNVFGGGQGETGADIAEETTPPVLVEASYELRYRHSKGEEFDSEVLQAFADTNAVFNAWPYFREFVQSSAVRMGLPPVLIPLFRLVATDPSSDEEGDPESS